MYNRKFGDMYRLILKLGSRVKIEEVEPNVYKLTVIISDFVGPSKVYYILCDEGPYHLR